MEEDKKNNGLSPNEIISIVFAVIAGLIVSSIFLNVSFTKIKPEQLRFANTV